MSVRHHEFWAGVQPVLKPLRTPCFVVSETLLARNLAVLDQVRQQTGARILLALKGYAMWSTFPLLRSVLDGACASSPHETRLARENFGGEVHAFAAGYSATDMDEIVPLADHIVFNSFAQYAKLGARVRDSAEKIGKSIHCGLRINPEHSEGAVPLYDPCAPGSRLGIRYADFLRNSETVEALAGISGLHFHTLCEQNADALERTLDAVERNFGPWLERMEWINFGGGHHITRDDYDLDRLCRCIDRVRQRYGVQVYVEPGEAVALNTGILIAEVLDVVNADMPVAILDTSAAAHMPDVLEMPYRPAVIGGGEANERAWTCRLAGKSCLAGDVIGEYSFDAPLQPGDRLIFLDMAIYSMVKTNTFNGLGLPDIVRLDTNNIPHVERVFGYEDFKNRLS